LIEETQEPTGADILLKLVEPISWALQPDEIQGVVVATHVEPDKNKGVQGEERSSLHPVLIEPV
jgi:hypothetical protein